MVAAAVAASPFGARKVDLILCWAAVIVEGLALESALVVAMVAALPTAARTAAMLAAMAAAMAPGGNPLTLTAVSVPK